jgi:3-oxoacyl-[acyl-carrier protein] reductase
MIIMNLINKKAIVTGASRGIGRSIAVALAQRGTDVAVNYNRDIDGAKATAKEIMALGRKALIVKADVANSLEVNQMVDKVLEEFGRIDILVNNAGIFEVALVHEMTDEQWDRTLNTNLKGVFNCCRAVVKHMIKQRSGKIVNISSIDAHRGYYGGAHYAASKAGIIAFTKSLAREVASYGICVNAVAPGEIETEMTREELNKFRDEFLKQIPLGRIGKPEDVAGVVVFLCSDEANYITGETINVNGGWWMI